MIYDFPYIHQNREQELSNDVDSGSCINVVFYELIEKD